MDKIYYIYILKNVPSSRMIVTHHLKTTFWENATFYFSFFLFFYFYFQYTLRQIFYYIYIYIYIYRTTVDIQINLRRNQQYI
jgi:hypothetical protein